MVSKKIFVCGECGKRYDNLDDWLMCCNRFKVVRHGNNNKKRV